MNRQQTFLLIGGTGKTGRRLANQLSDLGHTVHVASRNSSLTFQWEDQSTWKSVLDGVDAVYVAHHDITHPDAGNQLAAFSQLALSCGIRRQVLLSGRADERFLAGAESGIKAVNADWTILRPAWFMQNFSEMFFYEAVLAGNIVVPVGAATEPFIDVEDVASVAMKALLQDGHARRTYELTGPRLISFAEAASELTKATGRKIIFTPITMDDYRASLKADGLPEEYGDLYSGIADGKLAFVTDDVERILGRPARSFGEFAEKAAATGIWDV